MRTETLHTNGVNITFYYDGTQKMKEYNKSKGYKVISNGSSLEGILVFAKSNPQFKNFIVDCKNEGGDLHQQVKNERERLWKINNREK